MPAGLGRENAGALSPTERVVVDSEGGAGALASAVEEDVDAVEDDEQAESPRATARARTGFIGQTTDAETERFALNNGRVSFSTRTVIPTVPTEEIVRRSARLATEVAPKIAVAVTPFVTPPTPRSSKGPKRKGAKRTQR